MLKINQKIWGLLCLLLIIPISMVYSENISPYGENNFGEETIEAVSDLDEPLNSNQIEDEIILLTPNGAQIRLLQLEKRINAQILAANYILDEIYTKNVSNESILRLEEIVIEFENIVVLINNINLSQNSSILAQEYIFLKNMTIELTKEFREISSSFFNQSELNKYRIEVREKIQERVMIREERIEQIKTKYNKKFIEEKLLNLGFQNETIQNILNRSFNRVQISNFINENFKNLSAEEKRDVLKNLAIKRNEIREQNIQRINEFKSKISENLSKNIENRYQNIRNETQENIENRIKLRSENIQKRVEIIKNRRQGINDNQTIPPYQNNSVPPYRNETNLSNQNNYNSNININRRGFN